MHILEKAAPLFTSNDAIQLAATHYGLDASAHPLPSHLDQNFLLKTADGTRFVLKIANAAAKPDELDLQQRVLSFLSTQETEITVPKICPTRANELSTNVQGHDNSSHQLWMTSYVAGRPLAQVKPHTPELLAGLGATLGIVDRTLEGFAHPAMKRAFVWDLRRTSDLRKYLHHIKDAARRSIIEQFMEQYEKEVLPQLPSLRTSVVHNDANDYNVLVQEAGYEATISGIIDFGDVLHAPVIFELAIALAYVMLDKPDPLRASTNVIRGYHAENPLQIQELDVLYGLITARLCSSVLVSAFRQTVEPDNDYIRISEEPAWALLERLSSIHARLAHYTFREACGLEPCPQTTHVLSWLQRHAPEAAAVIESDLRYEACDVVDFSVGSPLASASGSTAEQPAELLLALHNYNAEVAVGRYNEARLVYTAKQFRTTKSEHAEHRTVHIGLDLFQKAGSPIFAPFDGIVYGFQDGTLPLDYGPVIILQHKADDIPFYTLYGHLSRASLSNIKPNQVIQKGQQIGTLGKTTENGGWAPHLHFQVILDLLGYKNTFPGVARPSHRKIWLSMCPDPNVILGIPERHFPKADWDSSQILESRRHHIGRNLSISYRKPLTIVRGYMQYLYNADGRAYLDAVNNVPHVGHSHPVVIQAARRQMAVLNTNTRYLHPTLVQYAERLTALMPEPLNVCFFVNSGSEANDLALRLAYTHTEAHDIIVLEGAYHGHLSSLIDISPYKFDGPGGEGAPAHVHKAFRPDPYRGMYRGKNTGSQYADNVRQIIQDIQQTERGVAAFICESILGCGGQIVFPEGYLQAAYQHTRKAGGVCIADEVQIGFGRTGTHFWGFETQNAVPDIVVLGKPMGNGHPMGAVVTTAEIANSFDTGMEFFSTFGGNPVSCAVGMAVLDVLEKESLQENAHLVGSYLQSELKKLQSRHPIIGDVRGRGLFLGIELLRHGSTRKPATAEAAYVINRMCEQGILISTDGPSHNVLKIKPPLVFTKANADALVNTLDTILEEDFVRPY